MVLSQLRSATRERHQRLDSALPLARPDPTLHDYAAHLRVIGAWRRAVAPWLARAGCADQDAIDSALRADLADCAAQGCAGLSFECEPAHLRAGDDASDAFAWGVAYVVEGSMLGGLALHRALAHRLAPHPLRYLAGHGAGSGVRWRRFLDELESNAQGGAAAAGACAAFDDLSHAFRRAGVL